MTEQQLIAVLISIHQVRPDPAQPRRLLPNDLAESFASGTPPAEILAQMRERSKRDKWLRERLAELDGLADSIAADGLMQPIRVIRNGDQGYHIEAGERRWWAHQILVGRGDSRFETIAAFVLETQTDAPGVLRRRVAENVHRSGFTAIELARAMATRIEEIAAGEPSRSRREIERRVGKENAISERRVRQFLGLLKLPPDVQELAQQARLTEGSLRSLAAIKDPARKIAAARALVNPNANKPSSRARSKVEEHRKAKRATAQPNKSQQAATSVAVQRLIALAQDMQGQPIQGLGKQLVERIADSKPERKAILRLRDVLNRSLKDVEVKPAPPSEIVQGEREHADNGSV